MDNSTEQIMHECLTRWGGNNDRRLQDFCKNFATWINQIPEEYRKTVLVLIENLLYYSHQETNKGLKELHSKLLEEYRISEEDTIYAFIKSVDGYTNSSNDYWTEYKCINGLNKYICVENTDAITDESWEKINNIIFIDDFSGTGKSFITEIEKNPDRYAYKNVFLITINMMTNAAEQIRDFCSRKQINIVLLTISQQQKAFERGLFEDDYNAYLLIEQMSKDFSIPPKEIMGFCNSQALIVFYNNTPNNTLGFIRYDTAKYQSIFPRKHDEKPGWLIMQQQRRSRKNANYSNRAKEG